ncbi:MAG: DNA-protecting protein DprA [Planctomycetes bacterium]|nr:DNA-protecting protein DprA [Planctomycetota bacterium]
MVDGPFTPEELLGPLNEVEQKNAPRALYVAGARGLLVEGRRVSLVGSRRGTKAGLDRAARFARALVERGVVVVSGLAEGIDTAAHRSALEAAGRTIAVLGTPLDQFFPAANRELQLRIMREHLAVSQFAPGSRVRPQWFPMRNRTMALLSDATVIVEAGEGSGTLHQGWEALRLGRPLFLAETTARDGRLRWPAEMVHYGAEVLAEDGLDVLFDALPQCGRAERSRLAL